MAHFLPLGSVVRLKGAERRVMICGRLQQDAATDALYDYSACLYPMGFLGADQMILFNAGDIEEVTFIGSQDEEELKFRKYMEDQVEKFIQETRSSSESND